MTEISGLSSTGTILDRIMAHKAEEVRAAKARFSEAALREQLATAPPLHDFAAALRREHVSLIAEVKKASPSKGIFLENFDPVTIAQEYETYGASAISVLTDERFFQGHLDYLKVVRQQVQIPILRKDFILDTYQIFEARISGANAVLLIVACLEDALLQQLYTAITELGMTALVEVHTAEEMERALKLQPQVIGINNRNLHNFTVDLRTTQQLAQMCPSEYILVAESGIHQAADVARMAQAGAHAVLVGESLVLAHDRPAQIRTLSEVPR